MTQSTDGLEPHEGIDPYNNPETRAAEAQGTPAVERSGDAPQTPAPDPEPADGLQAVDPDAGGTGSGDALGGVTIDPEEAEEAVSGDTGPEHPGVRRES